MIQNYKIVTLCGSTRFKDQFLGGYIGESTRREIAYAEKTGKKVRYLEEV